MILSETEQRRRPFKPQGARRFREAVAPRPERRSDRVAAIRKAIADGTYETPEKMDLMLDRLLEDLRSDS